MLVLAGCGGQAAPSAADPASAQTQMTQGEPQGEPHNCRAFTAQVMVGGQPQQAVGQACQQRDGSWQVTQNTPGLPQQVYTLPPQAIYLYPYPEPYYLVGSLVLWGAVLCRRFGFLRPWFSPFP